MIPQCGKTRSYNSLNSLSECPVAILDRRENKNNQKICANERSDNEFMDDSFMIAEAHQEFRGGYARSGKIEVILLYRGYI